MVDGDGFTRCKDRKGRICILLHDVVRIVLDPDTSESGGSTIAADVESVGGEFRRQDTGRVVKDLQCRVTGVSESCGHIKIVDINHRISTYDGRQDNL